MKTFKKISIAILFVAALMGGVQVQAQTLRDAEYHSMGRISPNGTVRDANYQSMGFFDKNGNVLDKANRVVGKVKNLQIYNTEGERIGYINTDGSVCNGESLVLGKIEKNGKVLDNEKNVIGYAQGISFEWIACYFFFDFFK